MADDELDQITMGSLVDGWMVDPIDDDLTPTSAFLLVKLEGADGDAAWSIREGGAPVSSEELLGALSAYVQHLRDELASDWG
jgi:hypothetical protein